MNKVGSQLFGPSFTFGYYYYDCIIIIIVVSIIIILY